MKIFTSSGGCGDSLIVGLKLKKLNLDKESYIWNHYEKHAEHENSINEIIDFLELSGRCYITNSPYKDAIKLSSVNEVYPAADQYNINGGYISSVISGFSEPYFDISDTTNKQYVIIQTAAGRMKDNTKRIVSPQLIASICHILPHYRIILIGPEKYCSLSNVLNLTGKETNLRQIFKLIDNCSLFIGQDGVLSYYSLMIKKPTIVNYHMSTLVSHYWNEKWRNHSLSYSQGQIFFDLSQNKNFQNFIKEVL